MPNTANNFARPESTVDTYPGEYQPTAEDWAEVNAHWDNVEEHLERDDVADYDEESYYDGYDDIDIDTHDAIMGFIFNSLGV